MSGLTPAGAVTLGEVSVESSLGQPLSARVPVELTQGELLGAACVSAPLGGSADLSRLPQPTVSVPEASGPGRFTLQVATAQPLYEPMYELQLQIRCPGTALLVRQYVLMLDLPSGAPIAQPAQPAIDASPASAAPAPIDATVTATAETIDAPQAPSGVATAAPDAPARQRPVRARQSAPIGAPIESGARYRVAEGDTLSTIAARISGRNSSLWTMADRIFAANPDAFIGGNQDLIKLGSEIVIPTGAAPAASEPATSATQPATAAADRSPAPAPAPVALAPSEPAIPATVVPTPTEAVEPTVDAATVEPTLDAGLAEPAESAGADDTAAVFEDELESPVAADASEELVAEATPVATEEESGAPAWLAALIGLLIGAAVSLVMLRERLLGALRNAFGGTTTYPVARPEPRESRPGGRRMLAPESKMVVEEHPHARTDVREKIAAEASGRNLTLTAIALPPTRVEAPQKKQVEDNLDSELSGLFGGTADTALEEVDLGLAAADELDLDLSAAGGDATLDQDIGWLGDDTSLSPTQEIEQPRGAAGGDTVEQVDLETLSKQSAEDAQISQTLKDALNLLESDYEDELTASQVIDRTKLREMLDEDNEDTLIRTGTDNQRRR